MSKYRTLDQMVKWKGDYIPPDTEVSVQPAEEAIWDKLVQNRVAIKVEDPVPEPEEGSSPDGSAEL